MEHGGELPLDDRVFGELQHDAPHCCPFAAPPVARGAVPVCDQARGGSRFAVRGEPGGEAPALGGGEGAGGRGGVRVAPYPQQGLGEVDGGGRGALAPVCGEAGDEFLRFEAAGFPGGGGEEERQGVGQRAQGGLPRPGGGDTVQGVVDAVLSEAGAVDPAVR